MHNCQSTGSIQTALFSFTFFEDLNIKYVQKVRINVRERTLISLWSISPCVSASSRRLFQHYQPYAKRKASTGTSRKLIQPLKISLHQQQLTEDKVEEQTCCLLVLAGKVITDSGSGSSCGIEKDSPGFHTLMTQTGPKRLVEFNIFMPLVFLGKDRPW